MLIAIMGNDPTSVGLAIGASIQKVFNINVPEAQYNKFANVS